MALAADERAVFCQSPALVTATQLPPPTKIGSCFNGVLDGSPLPTQFQHAELVALQKRLKFLVNAVGVLGILVLINFWYIL
jgi:hypothetical protein